MKNCREEILNQARQQGQLEGFQGMPNQYGEFPRYNAMYLYMQARGREDEINAYNEGYNKGWWQKVGMRTAIPVVAGVGAAIGFGLSKLFGNNSKDNDDDIHNDHNGANPNP